MLSNFVVVSVDEKRNGNIINGLEHNLNSSQLMGGGVISLL